MFSDYWKYHWVLEVHRYAELGDLMASLAEKVIAPAENKLEELRTSRKALK